MKLSNPLKPHEIAGRSLSFGRLTIGMGMEIETWLKTLPTELEQIERSGILKSVTPEVADSIASEALQRHDLWPPDAITAICDRRFLMRAEFGVVFVKAALRQYNPGLTTDDIDRIANQATFADVNRLVEIATGLDEIDPKDLPVARPETPAAATNSASMSSGQG